MSQLWTMKPSEVAVVFMAADHDHDHDQDNDEDDDEHNVQFVTAK